MGVENGKWFAHRLLCYWMQAPRPHAQVSVAPRSGIKQVAIRRPGPTLSIQNLNPSALWNRPFANRRYVCVYATRTDIDEAKPTAIGRKGISGDPALCRE